jgi:TIR domain
MSETKRPLKVFLCYTHADKPKVRDLYRYLKRRGIQPWFDEIDLIGGQDWQVEIPKALATSDAIIICLTKNSVDKEGYVQKEIKFALDKALEMPEGRIFLIPVRFEECEVPFSLSRYQYVDLFDEAGYSRMMRALKFRASQLERITVELSKTNVEEENLAFENAAREKAERDAIEKAAQERTEREAVEKVAQEKAEHQALEKAAQEKEKREAADKAKREKADRQAARKAQLNRNISESFAKIKSALGKAIPILRVMGIIVIAIVLFWIGSRAMHQFISLIPTAKPSPTITFTPSPIPPTQTPIPTPTWTELPTSTSTPTLTPVPQSSILFQEDFENGDPKGWAPSLGNWSIGQEVNGNHYWIGTGPTNYPQIWYGDKSTNWTDYAFENRIQFVNTAPNSGQLFMCVRSDGGGAFYAVFVNTQSVNYSQYNISKGINWTTFGSAPEIFSTNTWYKIRVEIKSDLLSTYVDNELVISRTLPSPIINTQGGIGYYMGGGDKFYIDDIKVWSLK